ncbi:hypothetical protein EON65_10875 [archaeon]|nr:MAG: hypothetical protein EON65_10875 [archaeon]
MLETLESLVGNTIESLEEMFQEGGKAEYLNWYMRLLTAGIAAPVLTNALPIYFVRQLVYTCFTGQVFPLFYFYFLYK